MTVNIPDGKPQKFEFFTVNTVGDIKQFLEVSQHTRQHTSYDLVFNGKVLDDFSTLSEFISNANQKTLSLSLKLIPYTEKALEKHLINLRFIAGIKSTKSFGINAGVSKAFDLDLEPFTEDDKKSTEEEEEAEKKIDIPQRSAEEKAKVSEIVSSFFEKLPQGFYTPTSVITPALRSLYYGPYNPVPSNYKAKGHLAYIVAQTFENEVVHITATTTGFYANKSSNSKFDPSPRENSPKTFTLFELISKLSKNFVSTINANIAKVSKYDRAVVAEAECAFLANPWITKAPVPAPDFGRQQFEDSSFKDFNHEYQAFKDLSESNLQDRILKEKLLVKCAFDFTTESTKTALDILNGAYTPMNPDEPVETHIYLQNGIFYSFGADVGTFAEKGGNCASRAASNQDVNAIKFINSFNSRGIYTLMTTIVDYAGKRVVCQTPVPGLFTSSEAKEVTNDETGEVEITEGETLTSIAYGFDDLSGEIKTDKEFTSALEQIRKGLHFKKKELKDGSLVTSPEIKGMRGTDKRKYILDLYSSSPLDIEFVEKNFDPTSELSYPHKQTVIRFEAVQDWWGTKARALIDEEAKKQGIDLNAKLPEGEEPPSITVDQDQLLFSVDAFSGENTEDSNVRDLSKYITATLIPKFLEQYEHVNTVSPIDGSALSSQLHKSGINVRYLGYIAQQLEKHIKEQVKVEEDNLAKVPEHNKEFQTKAKEREDKVIAELTAKNEAEKKGEKYELEEVPEIDIEAVEVPSIDPSKLSQQLLDTAILEMVARASKHILRSYSSALPLELVASLVSHFHNLLLGSGYNSSPKAVVEDAEFYPEVDFAFTKLTPDSVKAAIVKDVKRNYRYDLPENWADRFSSRQIQREIALKFGIQWNQRDYFFTKEEYEEAEKAAEAEKKASKTKFKAPVIPLRDEVFEPKDISFAPLIKDTIPRSGTAEQFSEAGRMSVLSEEEEKKQSGLELIREAASIYEQVYGELHPEVQKIYSSLSHLFQEQNEKEQAALTARKSLYIAERVYGLDSHDTFVSYLNLAYLELSAGKVNNALKVYGRLSQIWADVYGNKHVSIPTFYGHIVNVLQEQGYSQEATTLTKKLISLSNGLQGEKSFGTANLNYRLAFLYALQEKFNECIALLKETHATLREIASDKNPLTREADSLLKRINAWKEVNELNARATKAAEKALREQAAKDKHNKPKTKKTDKKQNMDDKSIDEVLNFINNGSSSRGKKHGKAKK